MVRMGIYGLPRRVRKAAPRNCVDNSMSEQLPCLDRICSAGFRLVSLGSVGHMAGRSKGSGYWPAYIPRGRGGTFFKGLRASGSIAVHRLSWYITLADV
jgi:hypothetical protein